TDDGLYDGAVEIRGVPAEAVLAARRPDSPLGGRLSGRITVLGSPTRPRLQGELSSPRLFLGEEGLGALAGRVSATGDGAIALAVEGTVRSARVDLKVGGTVEAAPPYDSDLRLEARDTSLDPFVRASFPAFPAALGLVASGRAALRGPLQNPRLLDAEATVPDLLVQLPEYPIRNRDPIALRVPGPRVASARAGRAGEGTAPLVEGGAALRPAGRFELPAPGAAALRPLSAFAFAKRVRGRGAARLAVTVSGTHDAPRVAGTLDL